MTYNFVSIFHASVAAAALCGTVLLAPLAMGQDLSEALQALDDALPGKLIHNPFDMEWKSQGNDLRTKVVDAKALPSGKAIEARLKKRQLKPWDSTIFVPISGAVEKGEEVQVYFWIRTSKPAAGSETARVDLFLGRNEEPYDNIFSQEITPSSEWKLMNIKGVAEADFPDGELKAEYQLGRAKQTVEVGPLYVSRLTQE